jgi:hypothetical protein
MRVLSQWKGLFGEDITGRYGTILVISGIYLVQE